MDSRITLHKLEVFHHVVEEESVTRAAEKLYVAQPVVTAHLRSLEERVGARLFYRQGRHLRLTDVGGAVYAWAEEVLTRTQELDRHIQALSDGTRGTVVAAASNTVGSYQLPPILSEFRRQRPLVHVRLNIWNTEYALNATRTGESDFAVVVADSEPSGQGLSAERIGEDEIVLVAAPYASGCDGAITVEAFAEFPFVETPSGMQRRSWIDTQLRASGITERRIVMELGHPEALKWAVKEGLGVSLLFRSSVAAELRRGELREVRVTDVRFAMPVFLVHRRAKLLSALHLDLMATIRDSFMLESSSNREVVRPGEAE